MSKIMFVMVFVIGLCACSEPQTASETPVNKDSKAPAKHMLSDQERMIQKAKDAEKLIEEADKKRRKALKQQAG